mgnify:CR=1 FL=1
MKIESFKQLDKAEKVHFYDRCGNQLSPRKNYTTKTNIEDGKQLFIMHDDLINVAESNLSSQTKSL